MHKRIIMVPIAVVVIALAAWFHSNHPQPKKGTVEWHKVQYLKSLERMHQYTLWDRTEKLLKPFVGSPASSPTRNQLRAETQARFHRSSLVALGYLVQRRYVITNQPINDFLAATHSARLAMGRRHMPLDLKEDVGGSNVLVISAVPEVAARYHEIFHRAEAPK